jgi:tripartite-type tricarboxylate transporter receptor subunit TctC
MTISKRRLLVALGGVAAILGATSSLAQAAWPERPIQLLIPYPPGGSADLIARPLSVQLKERLGQPVVLEYKPGAGGTLASNIAAKAKPDGYTFIMVLAAHAINHSLYPKLPYDTRKDFTPVSLVANLPLLVAGSSKLKANSIQELIAEAKASPGKITFGSAGNGNTSHLAAELFSSVAGVKMTHVPYKGSAPLVTAMLGAEVDVVFDSASTSLPHVQSGKLRGLAVTGDKRLPMIPNVPTMQEAGVSSFVVNGWYAVMAPAGAPKAVTDRLSAAIADVVKQPEFKAQLEKSGYQLVGSTPAALATHIESEITRWTKVVKESGATVD